MDLNVFDIFIPPAAKTFKCVMYKKVILLHFFGRLAPMAELLFQIACGSLILWGGVEWMNC